MSDEHRTTAGASPSAELSWVFCRCGWATFGTTIADAVQAGYGHELEHPDAMWAVSP